MTTEPKEASLKVPTPKKNELPRAEEHFVQARFPLEPTNGLTLVTGGEAQLRPRVLCVSRERGGWRLGVLSALLLRALSAAIGAHRHGDEKAHRGIWLSFAFPDAFSRYKGH